MLTVFCVVLFWNKKQQGICFNKAWRVTVKFVLWTGQLFDMLTKLGQNLLGEKNSSQLLFRHFETYQIPNQQNIIYGVEWNSIAGSDPQIIKSLLEQLENKDLQWVLL